MRKIIGASVLAVLAVEMTSCAKMPTREEVSSLQYGPPIGQADAESQAKGYLAGHLKDPYSAVYDWQPIDKGWVKAPPLLGGGLDAGWVLKGTVNAKNSFGGYVGARPYQFMFRNAMLVHVWVVDPQSGILSRQM